MFPSPARACDAGAARHPDLFARRLHGEPGVQPEASSLDLLFGVFSASVKSRRLAGSYPVRDGEEAGSGRSTLPSAGGVDTMNILLARA